jgi:hypothetical protein
MDEAEVVGVGVEQPDGDRAILEPAHRTMLAHAARPS